MWQILILGLIALGSGALAFHKPSSLFVFLVVAGPYYGLTREMVDANSPMLAWKDVLLAGLMVGIFLRLHGRFRCPVVLTILLIYCGISACIPGDWQIGALGLRATCQWMLLAVAASSLRDPALVPKVGRALMWSGTLVAVVYMVERTFFNTQDQIAASLGILAADRVQYSGLLDRFSAIYGNPDSIAIYLVICACFAFAWYLSERTGWSRSLAILCGGTCVAGVLFTASRGALPALVVALVLVGRKGSKKLRRMVLAGALIASVFVVQPDLLTQRLQGTTSASFFSSYRYQVWSSTLERAVSSPQLLLVGSGLGTYGGYVSNLNESSDVITENQFLKILGEQGVLGLLLMFGLIWRLKTPGAETAQQGALAVPAALAAVLTYCLFANLLDGLIVAVPFWILVGARISEVPVRRTQPALRRVWIPAARTPRAWT